MLSVQSALQFSSQWFRQMAPGELLNVRASHLVDVAELPEEDQQLLLELDPLGGMRQVRLEQRVVEEARQTSQYEAQILVKTSHCHVFTQKNIHRYIKRERYKDILTDRRLCLIIHLSRIDITSVMCWNSKRRSARVVCVSITRTHRKAAAKAYTAKTPRSCISQHRKQEATTRRGKWLWVLKKVKGGAKEKCSCRIHEVWNLIRQWSSWGQSGSV